MVTEDLVLSVQRSVILPDLPEADISERIVWVNHWHLSNNLGGEVKNAVGQKPNLDDSDHLPLFLCLLLLVVLSFLEALASMFFLLLDHDLKELLL